MPVTVGLRFWAKDNLVSPTGIFTKGRNTSFPKNAYMGGPRTTYCQAIPCCQIVVENKNYVRTFAMFTYISVPLLLCCPYSGCDFRRLSYWKICQSQAFWCISSKGTVKLATKSCNLFCGITAKRVEKRCCSFYPQIKPVLQQNWSLQVAKSFCRE